MYNDVPSRQYTSAPDFTSKVLSALIELPTDFNVPGTYRMCYASQQSGGSSAGDFSTSSTWLEELIGKGSALEGGVKNWDLNWESWNT